MGDEIEEKYKSLSHPSKELESSSKGRTEYCHLCDTDFPTSAHEMPNFKFHIITAHANVIYNIGVKDPTVTEIECKECFKRFTMKVSYTPVTANMAQTSQLQNLWHIGYSCS